MKGLMKQRKTIVSFISLLSFLKVKEPSILNKSGYKLLPGESHGQRSLVGYSPWGRKELDMTEQLQFQFHKLYQISYKIICIKILINYTPVSYEIDA